MIGSAQIGRIIMELKADVGPSAHIKSRGTTPPDLRVDLCAGSAEDGRKLPRLMYGREGFRLQGLLLPPRDSEVYVSGRRLHESQRHGRQVDLRREVRRRELQAPPRRPRHSLDGQRGPGHERLAVLPVHGADVVAGWEARGFRTSY